MPFVEMHPKHGRSSETRITDVHIGGTRRRVNGFGPDPSRKQKQKEMSSSVEYLPRHIVAGNVRGSPRLPRIHGGSAKMPLRILFEKMHGTDGRLSGTQRISVPTGGMRRQANGSGRLDVRCAMRETGSHDKGLSYVMYVASDIRTFEVFPAISERKVCLPWSECLLALT